MVDALSRHYGRVLPASDQINTTCLQAVRVTIHPGNARSFYRDVNIVDLFVQLSVESRSSHITLLTWSF